MAEKSIIASADDGKTPEQSFAERSQRVTDATILKQPNRIEDPL